jgi:hypothetical protein
MLDSDRFETPGKLVAYFGILPIEASSGVDRDGTPRGPKRFVMSRRGNDLSSNLSRTWFRIRIHSPENSGSATSSPTTSKLDSGLSKL